MKEKGLGKGLGRQQTESRGFLLDKPLWAVCASGGARLDLSVVFW
jgi:hypothetical protein